ncbi:hypothetical protein Moror_3279 [Moniliophthora roreri MCA 2997]|uniref:Uncharacterized protein n=1 Tax=Moniliophthora roreri (strain MCA 2997) TaxID=1381753 RepID=V2WNT5_MONRO|nr:hypothetical protein Moror_3279 [Moniliophthora roreri MCA 2997]
MQVTVDILILGAGWTSTFLIPLCQRRQLSYAATSRSGSNDTVPFTFDPESEDPKAYEALPDAKTVLITFPITLKGASERLVRMYNKTRKDKELKAGFIQLGATTVWGESGRRNANPTKPTTHEWFDRHSPLNPSDRGDAESELLALFPEVPTTVFDLAGLWGGSRSMRNYVGRVAPSKDVLKNKGSIHMIHGEDVARAILAVHGDFDKASGERWILSDMRVYDWWELVSAWGSNPGNEEDPGPQPGWVRELMREEGVRALPRPVEQLGRALDAREFWEVFGLSPTKRLD